MKKLIIFILICVPSGIFSQELSAVHGLQNNEINDSSVTSDMAFLGDDKAVFTTPIEGLTNNQFEYSNRILFNPNVMETNEDDLVLVKKNLLLEPDSYLGEGMVSFSKDKKTVFFSVNRKIKKNKRKNEQEVKTKRAVNLQLFKANVDENGEWVNMEMLPFSSTRFSTGQPFLNEDDTKLYFVSDGPESMGRTDIFVVDILKDGTYGKPVNLGPKINSREREIFPFIDKDNLLLFSSDVTNKHGELDVFVSRIFDNSVSTPLKLKGGLNIDKDDLVFNIDDESKKVNFSSIKQAGKGVEDIYAFVDASLIKIECQQEISGIVKNFDTQELLPNVQIMLFDENEKELGSFLSSETDASFSFTQSCNETYTLKGYLEGYLIGKQDIKTVNDLNAVPVEIVMNMSVDPGLDDDVIVAVTETKATEGHQEEVTIVETAQLTLTNEDSILSSTYNFNNDNQVFTVQIGAFIGKAQTDRYSEFSGLFNHVYKDGYNRYFSGIFESRSQALYYMELLKKNGYNDAFVIGLKGEERF